MSLLRLKKIVYSEKALGLCSWIFSTHPRRSSCTPSLLIQSKSPWFAIMWRLLALGGGVSNFLAYKFLKGTVLSWEWSAVFFEQISYFGFPHIYLFFKKLRFLKCLSLLLSLRSMSWVLAGCFAWRLNHAFRSRILIEQRAESFVYAVSHCSYAKALFIRSEIVHSRSIVHRIRDCSYSQTIVHALRHYSCGFLI